MEKMRRARINDSLNELKSLVLESLNKDAARYSKMEKADILEMSVQYLREIRKQEKSQKDATMAEYRAGFNHCAQEVTKNLTVIESPGSDKLRTGLMNHLALCYQGNPAKTSSSVPSTTQRFPADNRPPMTPVGPMWVYPSPPPSPLYMSPPVSPTLSPGLSHTMGALHYPSLEHKSLDDHQDTRQKLSSNNRFWRPWIV
ncbi:hypothetical protein QZH41_015398 [Actinostola sp. cb2023]|nr:hypothetical protein QZH41_015398 [Actinostola sp. cb2023]